MMQVVWVMLLVGNMGSSCMGAQCSPENENDCAASGDLSALLQGFVNTDGANLATASFNDGDDMETASFSQSEGGESRVGTDMPTVQGVHAWLGGGPDDERLTLSFENQGKAHTYELFPHNIYHEDAEVYAGDELLDVEPPRTYQLRKEGKWASVTLHDDGMVQGLLEDDGHVMEVTPVSHQEPSVAAALLLEYTGEAPAHIIRWVAPPQFLVAPSALLQQAQPTQPPDDTVIPVDTTGPGPIEEEVPKIGAMGGSWGGVKWYPGCYSGDSSPHEFILSFTSDKAALDKFGGSQAQLKAKLDSILNEASFVYEKQINIKLKMGWLKMGTTDADFGNCPSSNEMNNKLGIILNKVQSGTVPAKGASHLFTGCGARWGVLGIAYVGTICRGAYGTGANKIHGGSSPWLTFAHELGHNFAGKHSFEDGQGKTGGVMDYGNGKLHGHYQFNTKYRKQEMCAKMNSKVNNCNGNFQKDSGAPPTTPGSPSTPTSPPTSPPTPPPPSTGGSHCSFESGSSPYCGMWENTNGDQFDWTRRSGRTPSYGTGPDQASDGNNYMFIETSCPRRTGDKAILQTKNAIQLGSSASLTFDYHMKGSNIGTLKVFADADIVFDKTGQQGNDWSTISAPLGKYAGKSVTLKFVASRGSGWSGDIAIDNVYLNTGAGSGGGPATSPPTTMAPTPMPPAVTTVPPAVTTVPPAVTTVPPAMTTVPPAMTTVPPGGSASLEKKLNALDKKVDEILKLLKSLTIN